MTQLTNWSEMDFTDIAAEFSQMQQIRREAEIARGEYLAKLVRTAAGKIANLFHDTGDLFAFAQRMNEKARL